MLLKGELLWMGETRRDTSGARCLVLTNNVISVSIFVMKLHQNLVCKAMTKYPVLIPKILTLLTTSILYDLFIHMLIYFMYLLF